MAQCECLASEFGLRKIVLQKKKTFSLKYCHGGMIDNCYKSRVALQVTAREVMTFCFLDIITISGYITRFSEIVARKSGDLQIKPWLMRCEI